MKNEQGNVLFLILIAVALFAALSYAVTSSTRSGGGDAGSESNLISSAQITQYPASVNTAIMRMVVSGTSVSEIRFNRPSEFGTLDSTSIGVFHPAGGGANYIKAPADIMVSGNPGDWTFNGGLEVPQIGLAGANGGNDIIAYLVGIKSAICSKINEKYALPTTPPVLTADRSALFNTRMYDNGTTDYVLPVTDQPDIADATNAFDGQPFGCFQNPTTNDYVYYHVIVDR
ncbi:MAG: hypothetical protein OEY94_04000 [Alphaproteobacteria bacterium]|nr:hypothetical protein [Alphaproteobacteria bacterium]